MCAVCKGFIDNLNMCLIDTAKGLLCIGLPKYWSGLPGLGFHAVIGIKVETHWMCNVLNSF